MRVNPLRQEVVFDEEEEEGKCSSCLREGDLVGPCKCRLRYHQACMLAYIRYALLRDMRNKGSAVANNIKCHSCHSQIHFLHRQQHKIECSHSLRHLCSPLFLASLLLLLMLVTTLVIYFFFEKYSPSWLISSLIIEVSLIITFLWAFIRRYARVRQIILTRVLNFIELDRSNSSDEYRIDSDSEIIVQGRSLIGTGY